jgi:uncharacterized membrane protein
LSVKKPGRIPAFLAYLLPFLGSLFVLLFRRDDRFATFHAKQAIALFVFAIAVPVVWAVVAWILTWIPVIGAMTAVGTFALVMAAWIFAAVTWVYGIVHALRLVLKPLPLVGRWAIRYLGSW